MAHFRVAWRSGKAVCWAYFKMADCMVYWSGKACLSAVLCTAVQELTHR